MLTAYMPRIADTILASRLKSAGAVLIEGPKWCGKTTTAAQQSRSALYMEDPDTRHESHMIAETKPSLLLDGSVPRLLDEWQTAPVLWDAVRFAVDRRQKRGQFILTGSAVPPAKELPLHTGTGRISRMTMRPMSLFESGDSTGEVSLGSLFESGQTSLAAHASGDVERIAHCIVRGGWPAAVIEQSADPGFHAADYVEAVVHEDISRVDEVKRNPDRVRALLQALARSVSTPVAVQTLRGDVAAHESDSNPAEKTINGYLNALARIFVIEDLPAWNPALRSKTAIRTKPKREFVDPSIAAAVLGLTAPALLQRMEYLGRLFECMCIRDLRVYADAHRGRVYFYRDSYGLETDAVVVLPDGRWGAIEIKLGKSHIEQGAAALLKLQERVDLARSGMPSFLMVLTAGTYAYTREDGIHVVPAGCLRE